jgi:hypothetical protein
MMVGDSNNEGGCTTPGSPKCIIEKYYGASTSSQWLESFELYYYQKAYPKYEIQNDPYLSGTDKAIVASVQTRAGCANGSIGSCFALVYIAGLSTPGLIDSNVQIGASERKISNLQKDILGDPDIPGYGFRIPSSSSSAKEVLMPGGQPIGKPSSNGKIVTVNQEQMDELFNSLVVDARPVPRAGYPGQWYEFLDGSGGFGLRYSTKYGETLDLSIPGVTISKIHLPK